MKIKYTAPQEQHTSHGKQPPESSSKEHYYSHVENLRGILELLFVTDIFRTTLLVFGTHLDKPKTATTKTHSSLLKKVSPGHKKENNRPLFWESQRAEELMSPVASLSQR